MRVAIMGAGAIGCFFAAMLARAGQDVVLIGRQRHVDAINEDGLRLRVGPSEIIVKGVCADTRPSIAKGADAVLVSVKTDDCENAAAELMPYLEENAWVLSLQNGVETAARLRAALPQCEIVPSAVYVAVAMVAPGHVVNHGGDQLIMGASARSAAMAGALAAAGMQVRIEERIETTLWTKLTINCAYNCLSAITQRPYGDFKAIPGIREVMLNIVAECLAVAAAAGTMLNEAELHDRVDRIMDLMPQQMSSTAQDLAMGRPSEVDHLNGYIVQQGRRFGVPTPTNLALHAMVKLLEGP